MKSVYVTYTDEELKKLVGKGLTEDELDALLIELGEDPEQLGCHGFKMFALQEHLKKEIKEALKKLKNIS